MLPRPINKGLTFEGTCEHCDHHAPYLHEIIDQDHGNILLCDDCELEVNQ